MIQTTKSTACLICLSAAHAESANWVNKNDKFTEVKFSFLKIACKHVQVTEKHKLYDAS
jgi:hypothetical protein